MIKFILIFLFSFSLFAQGTMPNNEYQLGKGSSTVEKGFIFDTGDGASNPKLQVDDSQLLFWDKNEFRIGNGSNASDKNIIFNTGDGADNPSVGYDTTEDKLIFKNRLGSEKEIGSGGGAGLTEYILDSGFEEGGVSEWTCTDASIAQVASAGLNGSNAARITVSADDGFCDLVKTFTGDDLNQTIITGAYLKTSDANVTFHPIKDGSEFDSIGVDAVGEYYQNVAQVLTLGDTGFRVKGNDTEVIDVDLAQIKLGGYNTAPSKDCTDELDCENTFTARVADDGTVTEDTFDFIDGDCAITDGSLFTCSFISGRFSSAPNCSVGIVATATSADRIAKKNIPETVSALVVRTSRSSGGTDFDKFTRPFDITCTKTGADFKTTEDKGVVLTGSSSGTHLAVSNAGVTANQSIGTSLTTVSYDTIDDSKNIEWNTSTNVGTIQKAGFYDFRPEATLINTSQTSVHYLTLEFDAGAGFVEYAGTPCFAQSREDQSEAPALSCSIQKHMAVGEKFRVAGVSNNSSSLILSDATVNGKTSSPRLTVVPVLDTETIAGEIQGANPDRYCLVKDVKSSGTAGGTSSATPVKRDLNQTEGVCDYLTLADSTMTLQPGTYKISWSAPAYRSSTHQTALRDATAGTYIQMGSSEYAYTGTANASTSSVGTHIVTITAANNYEIFHEVQYSEANFGWGIDAGGSLSMTTEEIYTQVEVEKLK